MMAHHVFWRRVPFAVIDQLINSETGETVHVPATCLELTVVGEDGTTITDYWTMEQFAAMVEGVMKRVAWDA